MRTLVERIERPRARPRRRRQGAARRRLGTGAARPRGAPHPRLGRGRRPTPRPAPWPRSTPAASARLLAVSDTQRAPSRRRSCWRRLCACSGFLLVPRATRPATPTAGPQAPRKAELIELIEARRSAGRRPRRRRAPSCATEVGRGRAAGGAAARQPAPAPGRGAAALAAAGRHGRRCTGRGLRGPARPTPTASPLAPTTPAPAASTTSTSSWSSTPCSRPGPRPWPSTATGSSRPRRSGPRATPSWSTSGRCARRTASTAIGADRGRFDDSEIAARFRRWTELFGLGFSVRERRRRDRPRLHRPGRHRHRRARARGGELMLAFLGLARRGAVVAVVLQPTVPAGALALPGHGGGRRHRLVARRRARLPRAHVQRPHLRARLPRPTPRWPRGLVWVGDQLGVDLTTAVVVVFGVRIFQNLAAIRRRVFGG